MAVESLPRTTRELPDGWRMVTFGEVVRQTKVDADPETSGLERYIAGEHMDTDDLHIRRWGTIGDGYLGPAFHRRFSKGQILYGSRRTYLRKVAVADFDGITANTTFVLEPQGDALIPEVLPFVMQTAGFNQHSVKQSRGSVNPYVNFRDIADYAFPLPPKPEQHRIAEILWAADATVEKWRAAEVHAEELVEAITEEALKTLRSKWASSSIAELATAIQYGTSLPSSRLSEGGYPIVGIPNITTGYLDLVDLARVSLSSDDAERYVLHEGDILVVRTNGNPAYVGRSVVVPQGVENIVFASYLLRVALNLELTLPGFAQTIMGSRAFLKTVRKEVRSSAGNYNLNTKGLGKQALPVPPLSEQLAFVHLVEVAREALITVRAQRDRLSATRATLLSLLLGTEAPDV